jgi:hypothetical protein
MAGTAALQQSRAPRTTLLVLLRSSSHGLACAFGRMPERGVRRRRRVPASQGRCRASGGSIHQSRSQPRSDGRRRGRWIDSVVQAQPTAFRGRRPRGTPMQIRSARELRDAPAFISSGTSRRRHLAVLRLRPPRAGALGRRWGRIDAKYRAGLVASNFAVADQIAWVGSGRSRSSRSPRGGRVVPGGLCPGVRRSRPSGDVDRCHGNPRCLQKSS